MATVIGATGWSTEDEVIIFHDGDMQTFNTCSRADMRQLNPVQATKTLAMIHLVGVFQQLQ